jgi:hypothetical protein
MIGPTWQTLSCTYAILAELLASRVPITKRELPLDQDKPIKSNNLSLNNLPLRLGRDSTLAALTASSNYSRGLPLTILLGNQFVSFLYVFYTVFRPHRPINIGHYILSVASHCIEPTNAMFVTMSKKCGSSESIYNRMNYQEHYSNVDKVGHSLKFFVCYLAKKLTLHIANRQNF